MITNGYRLYLRMILVLLASVSQPPAGDFNVNLCSNESLAEYERTMHGLCLLEAVIAHFSLPTSLISIGALVSLLRS